MVYGENEPVKGITMVRRETADGLGVLERDRQLRESCLRHGLGRSPRRTELAKRDFDRDFPRGRRAHIDLRGLLNRCARVSAKPRIVGIPPDEGFSIEEQALHFLRPSKTASTSGGSGALKSPTIFH